MIYSTDIFSTARGACSPRVDCIMARHRGVTYSAGTRRPTRHSFPSTTYPPTNRGLPTTLQTEKQMGK